MRFKFLTVLLAAAMGALVLGVWSGPSVEGAVLCPPGTAPDGVNGCVEAKGQQPLDGRSARSETRAANGEEPPAPPLIRTITEGQGFTYTAPIPQNRQTVKCSSNGANWVTAADQPTNESRFCGTGNEGSGTTWGVCNGPWSLEVLSRDSRITTAGGRRIRVTTDANDNLDDTGTIEITYALRGRQSVTWQGPFESAPVTTYADCELINTARVNVRPAGQPRMTAAVALRAPSAEYLRTPSTVTWTCTQELFDALNLGGQTCPLNDVISTTSTPAFPTPRGCRIVVTVSDRGYGSTACLTSGEAADFGDMIGVDINTLPPCPMSTAPADLGALSPDSSGRQRCVARN